jgi:predicted RNA-binding protein with PIN domain
VADDLSAAACVEVHAPIDWLNRKPSRRGSGDDGVEAPAFVVDLHDVPRLDAFEPHRWCNCRLLAVRWLVDGMNVIGTRPDEWWKDRHRAMVKLVDLLERWAAAEGEDVTVVFEQPPSPPIRSTVIVVAHAPRPRRDSADDEIVRLLVADARPGAIRVVTSDLWLSDRVHAAGATVQPAASFREMLEER